MTVGPGRGDDTKRSIDRELRRGSIELAVLHVLSWGEAYGYEIVTKLVGQTSGALEVTRTIRSSGGSTRSVIADSLP